MRSFSGLRTSNALDLLKQTGQTLQSKIAIVTSVSRGRKGRNAPRAMFERFTDKAIKVILLAQEEARRLGHNYVGTELILLGLIGKGTGIAAKVLKSMDINLKDARVEVEKIIGRGSGFVAVEIPFTRRAKHLWELSLEEARQLGHNYIGSEHLLLGLLREVIRMVGESVEAVGAVVGGDSSGNKMPTLEEYGIDLTKLPEEGKLDPVVGRQDQIERVTQILGWSTKNNPCLIREPGVGKITIAEGLTLGIANGDVPETIEGKKVITLDIGLLVAGTKYRGELEESDRFLLDKAIDLIDEVYSWVRLCHAQLPEDAGVLEKELKQITKEKYEAVRSQDSEKVSNI
ncbi:ATP-dependent Clp protease ATP-binding subunit homolog CD4B, chloroplastic [Olea europaea subsp. europaea]|uniref:ATP-dependent Clp protease ATP-binding subunit homolog CD4B, chloroplastic n=1 Tax=Olea europaea subsp. europaea TaxID=158383 RepID=A0A8S0TSK3_OLEEU|nr:ATP-dependent Clp protease ATP-binding subunit homolog CD4B, chloroplastic [Olea europaea subsp. europaea]